MTRAAALDLLPYCDTDKQREVVRAVSEVGVDRAARKLGMDRRNAQRMIARLRAQAATRGYAPAHGMTHTVPAPYVVRGVSTLYDADGTQKAQWVKSSLDDDARLAVMREAVEAMAGEVKRAKPVAEPKPGSGDLLNLFVITDYHFGMRAWPEETRQQAWDTGIAEDLLIKWFEQAIALTPSADRAVLAQLGDFLHVDSLQAITPTSGHLLDADTRYQQVVRVVIRVLRRVVGMLLAKHRHVTLICAEGNHDLASSAWLRELFAAHYENEPRVTVDTSPDPYYCVRHGETALFFHHGHLRKFDQVSEVMAAKFRPVFGSTRHAYCHTGHYHHQRLVESPLMVTEQHRTLAASDAYASRGGWLSGRGAQVITYSARFGEVGRVAITPDMLEAA